MTTATWEYKAPSLVDHVKRHVQIGIRTPILWATMALFALSFVIAPGSVSQTGIDALLPFAAIMALTAVGQTLVIMLKGIDLSVPGMVTVGALVSTQFGAANGLAAALVLVAVIAVIVGLVNGLIIAHFAVSPVVVTLAMNSILIGAMLAYTGGTPTRANPGLSAFALDKTFHISNLVWTTLIIVAIVSIFVGRTAWGRQLVSAGSNEVAARAAGTRVKATLTSGYIVASLTYATAGVLLAAFLTTPNANVGDPYLLPVVVAVVLGGTSLLGGKGRIWGTVLGALFMSQLTQLVLSIGAPSSTQYIIQAVVIFVAVGISSLREGGQMPSWLRFRRPSEK